MSRVSLAAGAELPLGRHGGRHAAFMKVQEEASCADVSHLLKVTAMVACKARHAAKCVKCEALTVSDDSNVQAVSEVQDEEPQ